MTKKIYMSETAIRRRRSRILYATVVSLLSLTVLLMLVLLALLHLPLFRVDSVTIQGNSYIPADRIQTFLRSKVPAKGLFKNMLGAKNMLVWPDHIAKSDLFLLPGAGSITIAKNYSTHSITVTVEERQHEGVWCFRGGAVPVCYWFDGQGLISRTPSTEGNLILVLNDYARAGIAYGEPPLKPELLANLFSVFEAMKGIDVATKEIRIDDLALEEAHVPTYDGPTLLFSLRFRADNTPAAFKEVAAKNKLSSLTYIDFRVENRVYYK